MAQDEQAEIRAWKLFGLVPLMLMHRPSRTGVAGKSDLCHRADEFARAHWSGLVMLFGPAHIVHAHEPEEARWRRKFSATRQASQSAQLASFEGATGIDKGEPSSQERSHVAGAACEEMLRVSLDDQRCCI